MWQGTERVEIAAPPDAVWAIVSDVSRHAELAGSREVKAIRFTGPLAVGASWEADETVKGAGSFTARSEVVTLDPPREFSWKSFSPPIKKNNPDSVAEVTWMYRLLPSDGGTTLEESFLVEDPKAGALMMKAFYLLTRRASTIRKGMRRTLENVKAAAEGVGGGG